MSRRYLYRLDVTYPPGSNEYGWSPPGWDEDPTNDAVEAETGAPYTAPFWWPTHHVYQSRSGAKKRADLLRKYGATVALIRSNPVTWPDATPAPTEGAEL